MQTTDVHPDYLGKQDVLRRFGVFSQLERLYAEGLLRIYKVFGQEGVGVDVQVEEVVD